MLFHISAGTLKRCSEKLPRSFSCSSNNFFRGKRNTQSDGSALLLYQYQRQSNTTLENLFYDVSTQLTMFFLIYIHIYVWCYVFILALICNTRCFLLDLVDHAKVICTEKLRFSRAIGRKNLLLKLLSLKLHLQMTYYWNQNHISVSYVIQYAIFWH